MVSRFTSRTSLIRSILLAALITGIALVAQAVPQVFASSIIVNTTANELNADGDCSLREAIQAANTNSAVDNCFAGSAMPTEDSITLNAAGTYNLSSQFEIYESVLIEYTGSGTATINANGVGRAFRLYDGNAGDAHTTMVHFRDLRISDGVSTSGGCIIVESGTRLALTGGSTVTGCSVTSPGTGGGIYNEGTLLVSEASTISSSIASDGAGIYNAGTATIEDNSVISGNTAGFGSGGGIYNAGTLTITDSQIISNTSNLTTGGALAAASGSTTSINGSCIIDNGDTAVVAVAPVIATGNWWGAAGGPSGAGPSANGDSVGGNIDFSGWLTAPVLGCADHGVAAVTLDPTSVDFGDQTVNTTSSAQTITLTNSGDGLLTINSIGVGGGFSMASTDCPTNPSTLAPAASCSIGVTFSPTAETAYSGSLSVTHSAASSPDTVMLTGNGVAALVPEITFDPASLSFSANLGTYSAYQTVTVTNTGTAPVTFSGSLSTPANFNYINNDCPLGSPLAVGASCTVQVRFQAFQVSTQTGTFQFFSQDIGATFTLPLEGEGVLLTNGSFETDTAAPLLLPDGWQGSKLKLGATKDGIDCATASPGAGTCSMRFKGDGNGSKLKQEMSLNGSEGDVLTLAFDTHGSSIGGSGSYRVRLVIYYIGGGKKVVTLDLPNGSHDWTARVLTVTAAKDYYKIRVQIHFSRTKGFARFDHFVLTRD